jgi:two-component system chemotaxis sensor kinase CheA
MDDGLDADLAAGDVSVRSLSQTVRVDLHRLDHLMNLVGELGVVQASLGALVEDVRSGSGVGPSRELELQVRAMSRKLALLQQGILDVRMVPLGQVFDKLSRVVRKLGRDAEKDLRLFIAGADTELDKLIVEELSDPLVHMIRNAIDHGIERPAERVEAGKQAVGRVDLRAYQRGNRVVIEVEDDGRGIDWQRVRDRAMLRGLISVDAAASMGPAEALELLFLPGFTTKDEVTELSGRGVGMDVVKTNITRLSGIIDVDTVVGRGTKFSVTLPVTLAIIQALVVESSAQIFCIPLNSVLESIMISWQDVATVEGHEVVSIRGRTLPLLHLSQLFGLPGRPRRVRELDRIYVVVVGIAQHRVGIVVDELLGQQDVVIKPLGRALKGIPGIAGATELGANRTVLLVDVATLVGETGRREGDTRARERGAAHA